MKIDTNENKIDELLSRSVKEILPTKKFLKSKLMSGEKLRIYIGTDATGTSLHLGHATNYIILEKFRKLGHEVIFLIGDFTSRIGDPTDKGAMRVQLTREQVKENIKTWMDQIRPVINFENPENPVKIMYNHDWLSKMSFEDVIDLSSNFTVQQMLERDMFEKRISENKPIHLHEFFYPLMQGWDSVVMDVDIEMCGNDQKFNALVGRTLQKRYNDKEKFVFITTLLENPITKEKMMSKSMGTGVFLDFSAKDMFGSIMAQDDANMYQLFVDCTYVEIDEINTILSDKDIRQQKIRLATEITEIYHGEKIAHESAKNWIDQFSYKNIPTDIPEIKMSVEGNTLNTLRTAIDESKSQMKRLFDEGAVKRDGEKINEETILQSGDIIQIGKKHWFQIR
jgi:tyrosyl-tRNA synthetase